MMEDGKGGVAVKGLEEVAVANPEEIFDHIRRGSAKRRTAETLMNKQSSRSHSVFSVTVHTKESTPRRRGRHPVRRFNLVDLAGSENISRSGAVDKRAREAGEINKSLLTLGRVIAALVLRAAATCRTGTRSSPGCFRDALGGKSKTCIIATVSPAAHSAERRSRRSSTRTAPRASRTSPRLTRVTKNALLKDLQKEIERLTADLTATREERRVPLPAVVRRAGEGTRGPKGPSGRAAERLGFSQERARVPCLALFEDQKKGAQGSAAEHATHAEKVCIAEREARVATAELSKEQRARLEQAHLADEFEAAQERLRVKTDSLGDALASAGTRCARCLGRSSVTRTSTRRTRR